MKKEYTNKAHLPKGEGYIKKDKYGNEWVYCCWCGKRQFILDKDALISRQHFICMNDKCKKPYNVNQIGENLR